MKKHIVCFGDSNTHGLCADPTDCADGGTRFNENERWTHLLQKKLGEEYLVIEEGLSGRTTVFTDPLHEGMSALDVAYPILMSHEPIDLLIIMLGSNDTKARFCVGAPGIALGMDRLIKKIKSIPCWTEKGPNILMVSPAHIREGMYTTKAAGTMGQGCAERSAQLSRYLEPVAAAHGCAFFDAEGHTEVNQVDYVHLTRKGHAMLAENLAQIVPALL
jgi:lysophospholipase L1-like esterase